MGKSDWKASALEHKYAELPEENKSKSHKKKARPKKADHRHTYENCVIESELDAWGDGSRGPYFHVASYCTQCGKVNDAVNDGTISKILGRDRLLFCFHGGAGDAVVDELCRIYRTFHVRQFDYLKSKYIEI